MNFLCEEKEVWKDIKGYENYYQVSDMGRVKSLERVVKGCTYGKYFDKKIYELIMKENNTGKGYLKVSLNKNGKRKSFFIHRLVAQVFILNPNGFPNINHKDGIKSNNNVENLEWCTHCQNMKHAVELKLFNAAHGEKHFRSKLSESDVKMIVEWDNKGVKRKITAYVFGIGESYISSIVNRKVWGHLW